MILPALLLTLDKYSSWRVGRVVPMILAVCGRDLFWQFAGEICFIKVPEND